MNDRVCNRCGEVERIDRGKELRMHSSCGEMPKRIEMDWSVSDLRR